MEHMNLEVSWKTIIKFFLVGIGFWVLWQVKSIVFIILIVVILAAALLPLVRWMGDRKIPKGLAILLIYLVFALIFSLFVYFIVPLVVQQVQMIAADAPYYVNKLTSLDRFTNAQAAQQALQSVSNNLGKISSSFFSALISIFGGFFTFLTVLVLTFYLLVDSDNLTQGGLKLVVPRHREHVKILIDKVSVQMGRWFRGQLSLMTIVGVTTGIGLGIIGVPFALTLGVLAGFLEIVPFLGPIIAAVLALVVAIANNAPNWQLLVIIILYVLIQQFENQILVPKIMQKAVGLSPAIIIVAILVGGSLFGLSGAVLSIPIAASASVLVSEYLAIRDHLHKSE